MRAGWGVRWAGGTLCAGGAFGHAAARPRPCPPAIRPQQQQPCSMAHRSTDARRRRCGPGRRSGRRHRAVGDAPVAAAAAHRQRQATRCRRCGWQGWPWWWWGDDLAVGRRWRAARTVWLAGVRAGPGRETGRAEDAAPTRHTPECTVHGHQETSNPTLLPPPPQHPLQRARRARRDSRRRRDGRAQHWQGPRRQPPPRRRLSRRHRCPPAVGVGVARQQHKQRIQRRHDGPAFVEWQQRRRRRRDRAKA